MNWKLRFQNKTTLVALISALVTFVYAVLSALGIVAPVGQEQVLNAVMAVLTVLCALGIITDPTTAGISDSKQAMTYEEPKEKTE